jgi:transposase InsO family protein
MAIFLERKMRSIFQHLKSGRLWLKIKLKKVKKLGTDNGMEFCSHEFKSYCKSEGIARHYTVPYTPQQIGVVERMNRTIISKARCMLTNSGLNRHFGLKLLPLLAISLIVHPVLLLIRKLQLRYVLVLQLIIHN